MDNRINKTNNCLTPHSRTFDEFLICYSYFASNEINQVVIEIGLAILSFIIYLFVVILILIKSNELDAFDKVLIHHCIIQTLTSLLDIPFYRVNS